MKWIRYVVYVFCVSWCVLGVALFVDIKPDYYEYYKYVKEDVNAEVRKYIDGVVLSKYGHSIDVDLQEYVENKKLFDDYVRESKRNSLNDYRSIVFIKRYGHMFNSSSQLDLIGWNEIDDVLWEEFYPEEEVSASPYGFEKVFYEYIFFKYKDLNRGDVVVFASNVRKRIVDYTYGDRIKKELQWKRVERVVWTVFPPVVLLVAMWGLGGAFRRLRARFGVR